jgi:hypothetical protein
MCRTKSEVVACQMCGTSLCQKAGKGRAKLYCSGCRRARYQVGESQMQCRTCGKTWMRRGPGRVAKYCSPRCRHLAEQPKRRKKVACVRCGKTWTSLSGQGKLCPDCHHWRPSSGSHVECKQCGKRFYRSPSCTQQHCSRLCLHASLRTWHTCLHCGKEFSRRKYRSNDKRQYCRMQCYWDAHGMDGSVAARLKGRWAGNTRKRCRKAGVPYDPSITITKVAERDAYQCQICMRQCNRSWLVRKSTRKPHPLNRTIDHIVPIVAGVHGHEWHNVQCACVSCNLKKGHKRHMAQLRLL